MRRVLMLLCLLAMTITPTIAQTDEAESWEIIERCVDEPAEPPDDWSFEGIIFLKSNIGIHGLNSSIETPYILAYENDESYGYSGAISPDGRWFAVPTGHAEYANMVSSFYIVETIKTVRTDGHGEVSRANWNWSSMGGGSYIVPEIRWISENEYVYRSMIDGFLTVNPLTEEIVNYAYQFYEYGLYSPDYSRIALFNLTEHSLQLIQTDNDTVLLEFVLKPDEPSPRALSWQPNSASIVLSINGVAQLYGRDGELQMTITDDFIRQLDWNPNNTEFAYISDNGFFLGNLDSQELIDTCINATGLAWSPNEELAVSDGERIRVINFENNTHYIAAYHQGSVFDWRVPPEEN